MDHRPPSRGPYRSEPDRGGAKKRKLAVVDEVFERNAYASFVTAANSISQLYQNSVQSQRKSAATASKQTLVNEISESGCATRSIFFNLVGAHRSLLVP